MAPRLSTIGAVLVATVAAAAGSIYATEVWSMIFTVVAAVGATAVVLLTAVTYSRFRTRL
jgi:hypothetical protein